VTEPKPVDTWLTDMDGVLVHEERAIPGAGEFIAALQASGKKFLVLTNNSIFTPRDLRARLLAAGIDIPERSIWTSALATAQFLDDQRPRGTAYVIGEAGLTTALHEIGYVLTERDPATGSVAALITRATGVAPYFVGKPNPLMMRSALNRIEGHSETTVMIGDRMDTDIISGLEAGLRSVLVLSGSTADHEVERFPYRPTRVVQSIADVVPLVTALS
jgi:NagD protein